MMKTAMLILMAAMLNAGAVSAQDIAHIRHKAKLLRGKWQLTQTYNNGVAHSVAKSEYDAVVTLRAMHHYQEEVNYEGYHWILKGKWKINRRTTDLYITDLEYISGAPPGAELKDIHFSLYQFSKTDWAGDTESKGQKVKMEYKRIPAVKKKSAKTLS